jgi:hypothetical protein
VVELDDVDDGSVVVVVVVDDVVEGAVVVELVEVDDDVVGSVVVVVVDVVELGEVVVVEVVVVDVVVVDDVVVVEACPHGPTSWVTSRSYSGCPSVPGPCASTTKRTVWTAPSWGIGTVSWRSVPKSSTWNTTVPSIVIVAVFVCSSS